MQNNEFGFKVGPPDLEEIKKYFARPVHQHELRVFEEKRHVDSYELSASFEELLARKKAKSVQPAPVQDKAPETASKEQENSNNADITQMFEDLRRDPTAQVEQAQLAASIPDAKDLTLYIGSPSADSDKILFKRPICTFEECSDSSPEVNGSFGQFEALLANKHELKDVKKFAPGKRGSSIFAGTPQPSKKLKLNNGSLSIPEIDESAEDTSIVVDESKTQVKPDKSFRFVEKIPNSKIMTKLPKKFFKYFGLPATESDNSSFMGASNHTNSLRRTQSMKKSNSAPRDLSVYFGNSQNVSPNEVSDFMETSRPLSRSNSIPKNISIYVGTPTLNEYKNFFNRPKAPPQNHINLDISSPQITESFANVLKAARENLKQNKLVFESDVSNNDVDTQK